MPQNLRIGHLERELIQSRADMRVVSEEQESATRNCKVLMRNCFPAPRATESKRRLETSHEELQSTNERILGKFNK